MKRYETVEDFRQRIAVMMRERETGNKYEMVGASAPMPDIVRTKSDRGFYPPAKGN
jgi:hypothetical protein